MSCPQCNSCSCEKPSDIKARRLIVWKNAKFCSDVKIRGDLDVDGPVQTPCVQIKADPLRNTKYGFQALAANTTGVDNTAIGDHALALNQTGIKNTAIGSGVLASSVGVFQNTGVGFKALNQLTFGAQNLAVGGNTLGSLTNGFYHTGLGDEALRSLQTGFGNTADGFFTLSVLETGNNNTALGNSAGLGLVSGDNNTLLGYATLPSDPNVSNEVTIGNDNVTQVRFSTANALPVFPDNATALGGGLTPGMLYRTGGDPDLVCIVH